MTQPVYNVYRGQGEYVHMTYRVIPGGTVSQFLIEDGWRDSPVTERTIRGILPLVAKNVRFKA